MREVEWTKSELVPQLHERHPNALFYDTSTNAPLASDFDYVIDARQFSPFIPYGGIPVPKVNEISDSVEGVWQGLKIIKGRIDKRYFRGKGRKRRGRTSGHFYGDRDLSYIEARKKIYVPAYTYMFEKKVPPALIGGILLNAERDAQQYFFDVDVNPNIDDPSSPLSHASILVRLLNQYLQKRRLQQESQPADHLRVQE